MRQLIALVITAGPGPQSILIYPPSAVHCRWALRSVWTSAGLHGVPETFIPRVLMPWIWRLSQARVDAVVHSSSKVAKRTPRGTWMDYLGAKHFFLPSLCNSSLAKVVIALLGSWCLGTRSLKCPGGHHSLVQLDSCFVSFEDQDL